MPRKTVSKTPADIIPAKSSGKRLMAAPGSQADDGTAAAGQPASAPLVNRTAKTIQPLAAETDSAATEPTVTVQTEVSPPVVPAETAEPAAASEDVVTTDDKAEPEAEAAEPTEQETAATDSARLEAEAKRENELEALITSGKYFVPINAVQRKRSRMLLIVSLIVLVLIVLLALDLLADKGVLKLPGFVPHSRLLTKS